MDESSHSNDTLQEWLGKLQTTDDAAFDVVREEVIRLASIRMESLVRKMLRNYPRLRRWEQTADVLQNSLFRLHHALSTIHPENAGQFFGLAATQIRRELIDLTRHHFGPEGHAARHHTDGIGSTRGKVPSVEREADNRGEPSTLAEWTDFHEAVQKLPEVERQIFELYWYQGLDQKTIASLLKVTDRTVKNRWRNAKLFLRRLLNDRED
jgi:RNA polymerase sigma factor (sigma-70 family)